MSKRKCIRQAIVELSDSESEDPADDDCVIVNSAHLIAAKKGTSASTSGGKSAKAKSRITGTGESQKTTNDKTGKSRGTKAKSDTSTIRDESKVAVSGRKRKISELQSKKMGSNNSTRGSAEEARDRALNRAMEKAREQERIKLMEERQREIDRAVNEAREQERKRVIEEHEAHWREQDMLEKHYHEQKLLEDAKLKKAREEWNRSEALKQQQQLWQQQCVQPQLYPHSMVQEQLQRAKMEQFQPFPRKDPFPRRVDTSIPPPSVSAPFPRRVDTSIPPPSVSAQFARKAPIDTSIPPPSVSAPSEKKRPAKSKTKIAVADPKPQKSKPSTGETAESYMAKLVASGVKCREWTEIDYISEQHNIPHKIAENIVKLFKEDNTVPFIARYRKSSTNGMEADTLRSIQNSLDTANRIKHKASAIIKDMDKQGKWTAEFHAYVQGVKSLNDLEHIHSIFKVAKSTLAERARKLGLDVPARAAINGEEIGHFSHLIKHTTEGLKNVEQITNGVICILADMINKDERTIEKVKLLRNEFSLIIKTDKIKTPDKEKNEDTRSEKQKIEDHKYDLYHAFSGYASSLKPHQVLAINRGEARKILSVKVAIPDKMENAFKNYCTRQYERSMRASNMHRTLLNSAFDYVWNKSIKQSIKRRTRQELNEEAEVASMDVFARNVQQLLLTPPVRGKVVMGVDPGFRHGCKLAVVSEQGDVLETDTVYFLNENNANDVYHAKRSIVRLVVQYKCTVLAIGNGTACRETETYFSELIKQGVFAPIDVVYTIVNETGASIYSCGPEAKAEFPDMEVNVISAVSIARRLQDPMAELVKIEPRHLGVGMYQHDLPEKPLMAKLNETIMEAVSFVGVDVNTASVSLLKRVAGLGESKAMKIVEWRKSSGPFKTRNDLTKVRGIASKTFEQCAGFIRIMPETAVKNGVSVGPDSLDYLDQTWIHPESYDVARAFVKTVGCDPRQIGTKQFIFAVELNAEQGYELLAKKFKSNVETMEIIVKGLSMERGQDIRAKKDMSIFRKSLMSLHDLKVGTIVSGVVRNITHFGAFVDIGIEIKGLIHKTFMDGRTLAVGERVEVRVINIEKERNRIGLALI